MQHRQILNRMLGVALLAMLFGVPSVQAQSGETSGSSTQAGSSAQSGKPMSRVDQNIIRELAVSNLAEIEAGKIALNQSKNDQVRNFAQRMVDDHQNAQKDLEELAQAKGVSLPTEPDNKHKSMAKKLSALEGEKFDKQYMKQGGMNDHKDTHRLLQSAQKRASDPELKALVEKMEPVVSQHLTMAQEVSGAKGSASGSQGPAGTSASGTSGSSATDKPGATGTSGSSSSTGPNK